MERATLKERMLAFLGKLEKAEALLKEGKVHPVMGCKDLFVVESQEGRGHYLVDLGAETCTCPAWAQGKTRPCKHLLAAVLHLWTEGGKAGYPARAVGERPVA